MWITKRGSPIAESGEEDGGRGGDPLGGWSWGERERAGSGMWVGLGSG